MVARAPSTRFNPCSPRQRCFWGEASHLYMQRCSWRRRFRNTLNHTSNRPDAPLRAKGQTRTRDHPLRKALQASSAESKCEVQVHKADSPTSYDQT